MVEAKKQKNYWAKEKEKFKKIMSEVKYKKIFILNKLISSIKINYFENKFENFQK